MFDWNDEELDNIIWGEAAESDDHIVPYPKGSEERPLVTSGDHNRKEWKLESATKTPGDKTDFDGNQLESISHFDTNELSSPGFGMESWPDLSLSNAAKADQDSMSTELSNNLTRITKYDISIAEKARLDKDHGSFQNRDEDKEQNDFIDYGWANIGSFDDLDKIFSNDDPLFGHVSLGNADELWSSSKDVSNSPVKSIPLSADSPSLGIGVLRNASEHFKIKTEYVQDEDQSLTPNQGKMSDPTSHGLQNVHAITDQVENEGGKSKPIVKEQMSLDMVGKTATSNSSNAAENVATQNKFTDKVNKQRKVLKYRKKLDEKSEGKLLQGLYGTWSPPENQFQQFEKQVAPSQQRKLQGHESLPYQHISYPYVAPYVYGNLTNQYPAISVLPRFHSGEDNNQQMLSGYEVPLGNASHLNKSLDGPLKPMTMTPQEKVEKLRRRQQMQAMLAILKQQQQFSHQVSSADHSITQQCPPGIKIHHIEGADIEVEENLSTFPPLDLNSPIEQDDSNTMSIAIDDYSVEETVLYHLQDIISKLDIKIRLCIRDSLFRLAQSAMQRHYASDTSSTNKNSRDEHEAITKEEINSHNRYDKMLDVETETNPIDRTVAHLLFHRPLEISGKHSETPESPISTKLTCERKRASLVNLSMGCLPDNSENKQNFPHQGSKTPCPLAELQHRDQLRNSPCRDTSENASNNDLADGGAMEVEASH